jgi:hypothetical protein
MSEPRQKHAPRKPSPKSQAACARRETSRAQYFLDEGAKKR